MVGESVVLTRDDDGALHAAYNVCRHRGSQLVPDRAGRRAASARRRGRCAAPTTRGPTRSTAGCCKAPHTDGRSTIDPAEFSLHPVGVEEWAGFVFVHLDARRRRSRFADGVGRATANLGNYDLGSLVTGLTLTYDVAANWKVLAENYNECYHCGPVHPELSRLVPSFGGGGTGSTGTTASRTARAPGRSR